jgi:hypothetical protein
MCCVTRTALNLCTSTPVRPTSSIVSPQQPSAATPDSVAANAARAKALEGLRSEACKALKRMWYPCVCVLRCVRLCVVCVCVWCVCAWCVADTHTHGILFSTWDHLRSKQSPNGAWTTVRVERYLCALALLLGPLPPALSLSLPPPLSFSRPPSSLPHPQLKRTISPGLRRINLQR